MSLGGASKARCQGIGNTWSIPWRTAGHNKDVVCRRLSMKINWKNGLGALLLTAGVVAFVGMSWPGAAYIKGLVVPAAYKLSDARQIAGIPEGPAIACEVTVGPFDIHRKYRSMEGPWSVAKFKIGELVASGSGELPESHIHYVEKEQGLEAPSMNSGMTGAPPVGEDLSGLKGKISDKKTLYWFKGLKVEVVDENGRTLPTAEFICHTNLDFSYADHNASFPDGERWNSDRLITITQGQTKVIFPAGFAVPLASDESFRVTFQAANRTTDTHRRLKHKATFYFIKDADLVYPITALYTRVPFAQVIVDRNYALAKQADLKRHPTCDIQAFAVNAPNNVTGGVNTDGQGRVISGHWVVPPGVHTYKSNINDLDGTFAEHDRRLRFAWTHIHPCCTDVSVTRCDGGTNKKMFTANVKTKTQPGLELVDIELVNPKEAIVFPKDGQYEVEGTYNNTLPVALDSMISVGMFFEDTDFRRPSWSMPDSKAAFCGVVCKKEPVASLYPMFSKDKDGPLLKGVKAVELNTNRGSLKLLLDPAIAPCSATQLYRMMISGGFDGTRFASFQPGFLLQIAAAEDKASGKKAMPSQLKAKLRRLPLEARGDHRKHAISIARTQDDLNSGATSICLMLGPATHLNGKYTVVGRLSEDAQSLKTLDKLSQDWQSAVIVSARAVP